MQSKGIALSSAIQMLTWAYMEQILGHFELTNEERKKFDEFLP
jgi:hypothetical protein